MRRSTLKLAIRHETIRVLAELDLVHVAAGNADKLQIDTGGGANNGCVQAAAVAPAKK